LYLQCIKALGKKYKLSVTWVGDGELATECQKVGTVTGFVTDPQPYLAQADLVLASSYLSMLSAQVLGKLVLAFYSHRLKRRYLETYPGATYMLIDDSVSGMLDKLDSVMSNKQTIEKKAQAARAFAQTQTWDKVVEMYEELWLKQ
jgi:glycosyltransferase involved in cell wall biosynthesis